MLKRALFACAAGALLIAPSATAKPTKPERTNAAKECRAEGVTPKDGRRAFGECVREKVREHRSERRAMRREAVQECRDERGDTEDSRAQFREDYGTNGNRDNRGKGRNAFGKCVSSKVKEKNEEEEEADEEEMEMEDTSPGS